MIKKRLNFVSNSSSSSWICTLCGETEIYYDGDDNDMFYECDHGHSICISCLNHYVTKEMLQKAKKSLIFQIDKIINYQGDFSVIEFENKKEQYLNDLNKINDIENLIATEIYQKWTRQQDYLNYLMKELCPVCNFMFLLDRDYINYIQKIFNIPPKSKILENIKRTYLNYDEFYQKNSK